MSTLATVPPAARLILITVDTDRVIELRRLVARACGNRLSFLRMQPIEHASRMQVWLRVREPGVQRVIDAVTRALPAAQLGRVVPA
ncbi:hypothetical protein [Pseudoduganella armeniaca]|uniref:hypothetical protein n=1 Tax=Pseudoduganella armeniaca TaxID=2072590 RepID=UPI001E312CEB|nr:hypothetical protein [Pseudoduganella armeniaca]